MESTSESNLSPPAREAIPECHRRATPIQTAAQRPWAERCALSVERLERVRTSIARTQQAAVPPPDPAAGRTRAAARRRLHDLVVQPVCQALPERRSTCTISRLPCDATGSATLSGRPRVSSGARLGRLHISGANAPRCGSLSSVTFSYLLCVHFASLTPIRHRNGRDFDTAPPAICPQSRPVRSGKSVEGKEAS